MRVRREWESESVRTVVLCDVPKADTGGRQVRIDPRWHCDYILTRICFDPDTAIAAQERLLPRAVEFLL